MSFLRQRPSAIVNRRGKEMTNEEGIKVQTAMKTSVMTDQYYSDITIT